MKYIKPLRQIDCLGILVVILLATASRLIPHAPNFTPHCALALFVGMYIPSLILGIGVTISSMILSDLIIGSDVTTVGVYIALVLITLLGRVLNRDEARAHFSVGKGVGLTFSAAIIFFVVTNFAVWLAGVLYPRTYTGLVECFALAIPFFGNTLFSTVIYYAALVILFELAEKTYIFGSNRIADV